MFARYAASFLAGAWWLVGAAIFLCVFGIVLRRNVALPHEKRLGLAVLGSLVLFALVHAWTLGWLCDDAFISFRYAENWANGQGLVYNVGERVEGYTNFLWTAILTAGILAGAHPGQVSLVLSLGCLGGTIVLVERLARRLCPEGARFPGVLCGAGLASSYVFASFGTSGLETMAAALLVVLAVERAEAGAVLAAGLAGVSATLLHPDHVLFYAALGLVVAIRPKPRLRRIALYAAPFVVLFVPYFLARYAYYGDFFPNTYYAKSGGSHYFSQGFVYLGMSTLVMGLCGALPLAVYGVTLSRKTTFARFVMVSTPLYLAYVTKIGGDFMLGRLLCSVLPGLLLAAELGVRALLERKNGALALFGLVALAPVALPNGVVMPYEKYREVADERTFYPLKKFSPITVDSAYTVHAKTLRRMFRRAPRPPKLAIGAVGIVGFLTGYPVMDNLGLVNREVAHMKIRTRGRPGHEKIATPGHVFAYDVDFADIEIWPEHYSDWASFEIPHGKFWIAKYDPKIARSVRSEGTKVPDIEDRIRDYDPAGLYQTQLACDLWFFDQIYFSHFANPALKTRLAEAVVRENPSYEGLGDLLVGKLPDGGTWEKHPIASFDDFRNWKVQGDAFARGPTEREVGGQARVFGARGRFANSFDPKSADGAKGSLVSPKFRLTGDALTLAVGGGRSRRVQVHLMVGGNAVVSATGCVADILGRRVFPTARYRGEEAELEIVDRGEEGWDHILVDEIVEWKRLGPTNRF